MDNSRKGAKEQRQYIDYEDDETCLAPSPERRWCLFGNRVTNSDEQLKEYNRQRYRKNKEYHKQYYLKKKLKQQLLLKI